MKKTLSLLLALCMIFAFMAVSASAEDYSGISVVGSRWAGPNADVQKQIVADFNNPTIVIDDVDYGNLKEKQILSMSTSGEYDLIWVPEVWLPEYVENGWVLPLDDYVAKDNFPLPTYTHISVFIHILLSIGRRCQAGTLLKHSSKVCG